MTIVGALVAEIVHGDTTRKEIGKHQNQESKKAEKQGSASHKKFWFFGVVVLRLQRRV